MSARNRRNARAPLRPLASSEELDGELAQHLELLVARFVANGMSPEDALSAAHARFGDAAEIWRECAPMAQQLEQRSRFAKHLSEVKQDVHFTLRSLRRAPFFSTVAVLTLAVAIGANSAMFSVVNTVLLRGLPYAHADRVRVLTNSYPGTGLLTASVAPPEFAEMQEQLTSFDALAAVRAQPVNLSGDCGSASPCEPLRASSYAVSPNLFTLLGSTPSRGRNFVADDGADGAPPVAIISHALWVNRYGADSAILGRNMTVAGVVRSIVGVMPRDVRFPDVPVGSLDEPADLWVPYSWERDRNGERGNQFLTVLARSRAGVASERQQAELRQLESQFKARFPERYTGPSQWRISDTSLREAMTGSVRTALLLLWGIVALVLFIACANVANLMLARGASRTVELAVRAALGAGRGRLVRQLVVEAAILGIAAGAGGVLLGAEALRMVRVLAPASLPQLTAVSFDARALLFAIAAALLASVLCGVFPALQLTRTDLQGALRSGSRGTGGARSGRRTRRALVVVEVALTLVVLVNAGLLLRTFVAAQRVVPAFQADGVLTFEVALPRTSYANAASLAAMHTLLSQRLAELPGVTSVSAVYPLPLSGGQWSGSYYLEGRQPGPNEEYPNAQYSVALPRYFETMKIPLRAGREFTADDATGRTAVIVVNEAFAARNWPGENPLGKRVNTIDDRDGEYSTVVGVVPNVRRMGATDIDAPQVYRPFFQHAERRVSYVVRTREAPLSAVPAVRDAIRSLDAMLPLARISSLNDLVEKSVAPQRFNASVLGVFALIALLLASGGLFGVISYLVTQRNHELGVRMALGGQPTDIVRLVLTDGVLMAVGGVVIGAIGAWIMTRALQGLLFGVSRSDPVTWLVVPALLLVISLLAAWLPARRATRIDPAAVLRGQ